MSGKKRRQRNVPQRMTTDSLLELFQSRKELVETSMDNSFDDDKFDDGSDYIARPVSAVNPYMSRIDIANAVLNNKPWPTPRCDANDSTDIGKLPNLTTLDSSTDSRAENAARKCTKTEDHPSSDLKEGEASCDKATQMIPVSRTPVIVKRTAEFDDMSLHRSSAFNCHDNVLFATGYRPQTARSAGDSAKVQWVKDREQTEGNLLPGNKKILCRREPSTSTPIFDKMPLDISQRNDLKTRRLYDKLSRYLTLVYDYPKAFRKLRFLAESDPNMAPCVRDLILTGRLFGRAHHEFGRRESPVLLAAYELGSRRKLDCRSGAAAHPKETLPSTPQPAAQKTHTLTVKAPSRDRSKSPDGESREPFEKNLLAQHGAVVAGLWKAREDAEKALAAVSTNDGMRAREWVLRELEEDEGSVQQWWLSQKHCRYLRRLSMSDAYNWLPAES